MSIQNYWPFPRLDVRNFPRLFMLGQNCRKWWHPIAYNLVRYRCISRFGHLSSTGNFWCRLWFPCLKRWYLLLAQEGSNLIFLLKYLKITLTRTTGLPLWCCFYVRSSAYSHSMGGNFLQSIAAFTIITTNSKWTCWSTMGSNMHLKFSWYTSLP